MAAALGACGVQSGKAVAIFLPMTSRAVAIYLGCVLAGCAVVGIAESFVATEIAVRLRISQAIIVFTQVRTFRISQ